MSGSKSSSPAAGAEATLPQDQPLGLTVHSLPSPQAAGPAQRRRGRLSMLLVMLACAAPVLASYFTFYVLRPGDGSAAYGQLIHPPVPMPALTLHDLQGQAQPLGALKGQWLLVVVGDAACGEACERRLYTQRQLREMTGRERDRIDKLWLVTDEAPIAAPLQAALEGTPAMWVRRAPREAVAAWLQPAPGRRLEDHLYIVDPMGQWMMRMPADPDPAKVKRDIDRLLRAAASWDQAGR